MNQQCPRGYICLSNFNILSLIIIFLGGLYILNIENNKKLFDKINKITNKNNEDSDSKTNLENDSTNTDLDTDVDNIDSDIEVYDRDRLALSDPLYPPLKRNFHIDSAIQTRRRIGVPINIETRGHTEDYQQIGILYKESNVNTEGESPIPGNNTESNILPLFGRPLYRGSNNWLYYTSSDKFNAMKIPITYDNKECMDDRGCKELYDSDTINIPSYNGQFKVKIYKFDKPRYLPHVF